MQKKHHGEGTSQDCDLCGAKKIHRTSLRACGMSRQVYCLNI